jgi:hypothetical protein
VRVRKQAAERSDSALEAPSDAQPSKAAKATSNSRTPSLAAAAFTADWRALQLSSPAFSPVPSQKSTNMLAYLHAISRTSMWCLVCR